MLTYAHAKPGDFNLYTPTGSVIIITRLPVLEWEDTSDTEVFNFVVYYSTVSDFSVKTSSVQLPSSTTTYGVPSNLIENATYWWNVYAENIFGDRTYASTETFRVNSMNENPTGCAPLDPLNNDVIITNTPTFYWQKAEDPDPGETFWYKVWVSTDDLFSFWTATEWVSDQLFWSIDGWANLDENTEYYWFPRVRDREKDEDDPLYWPEGVPGDADIQAFWVNGTAESPTVPSLIVPSNKELITTTGTPELAWSVSTDPDPLETITYTIRYSTSQSDFYSGIYSTTETVNTSLTFSSPLIDNVTYWWNVMAVDDSSVTLRVYSSSTFTFIMNYVDDPPLPFDLMLPVDTTTVFDLTPVLRWEEALEIDPGDEVLKYAVWYDDDPTLTSGGRVIVDNITTTYYTIPSNLQVLTTYYWRVQAFDFNNYTFSSSTFSFYTYNHYPAPFTLVKASGVVTVSDVDVEWTASSDEDIVYGDALTYAVRYAETIDDLGTSQATTYAGIQTTSFTITGLEDNATYYWTVRAVDQNNFWTGTSTWTIRVNTDNDPPETFTLLSPSDGSIANDTTPLFDWDDAFDPDPEDSITYTIHYALSSDFSGSISSGNLTVSAFTPVAELSEDNTYWWKVYAFDEGGLSTMCVSTWTVRINAENQPPTSFNLVSPSDGVTEPTQYPIFIWDPATDSDPGDVLTYTVMYSTDSAFSVYESSAGLSNPTYTPPIELIENASYYWYVKVQDQIGAVNFSASTWTVVINATNEWPVPFSLVDPGYGITVYDLTPRMNWQDSYDPDPGGAVSYSLHYSTYANFSSSASIQSIPISEYTFLSELNDNTLYYWRVEARDLDGNPRLSNQTSWYFILNQSNDPPLAFDLVTPADDTVVNTLNPFLDWHDAVDLDPLDEITYRLVYSPDPNLVVMKTEIMPLAVSSFTVLVNLTEQTTYYWTVYASDGESETQATAVSSFFIEAVNVAPGAFSILSPSNGSALSLKTQLFDWEDSIDTDYGDSVSYTLLIAEGKSFSSPLSCAGLIESKCLVTEGLYENRVYYWKVVAEDESGYPRESDQTWNFFIPVLDVPKPPNVRSLLSADSKSFVISWDLVEENEDGSAYQDPGGYNIYRSARLNELLNAPLFRHVDQNVEFFEDDTIDGGIFFYLVRTVDSSGIESAHSIILSSTPEQSTIILSDDGSVYLVIFEAADSELLTTYHFVIEHRDADVEGRVLGSYQFKVFDQQSGEEVDQNIIDVNGRVYFDYSSIILRATALNNQLDVDPGNIGIFWHNGVEFVKCGGSMNAGNELLSLDTRRMGWYRVQQVLRAADFQLVQIWPRKTFTPNNDGINDEINFNFENPAESVVTGRIYDLAGAFIAHMQRGLNGSWSLKWDGRDSDGNIADKGVYIYQIEVDGKVINGTIIVAK